MRELPIKRVKIFVVHQTPKNVELLVEIGLRKKLCPTEGFSRRCNRILIRCISLARLAARQFFEFPLHVLYFFVACAGPNRATLDPVDNLPGIFQLRDSKNVLWVPREPLDEM